MLAGVVVADVVGGVLGVVVAGVVVVAGATVESVVADPSPPPPPPLQAGASKIAAVKMRCVVRLMPHVYQVHGGVRSRSEGA